MVRLVLDDLQAALSVELRTVDISMEDHVPEFMGGVEAGPDGGVLVGAEEHAWAAIALVTAEKSSIDSVSTTPRVTTTPFDSSSRTMFGAGASPSAQ